MHGPLIIFLRFKWILENMNVLSFEANATTITAEGQLYLCVFLTQTEQSLSRAWSQHPGVGRQGQRGPHEPCAGAEVHLVTGTFAADTHQSHRRVSGTYSSTQS